MATMLALFSLCVLSSSFSIAISASDSRAHDIDWWCNKTPYPAPCKYFMSHVEHKYGLPMGKSEFRKMAMEVAMERALTAQSHNKWLGSKCRNEREKAAWADCLKLYEDTIQQLNTTLDPATNCTDFDQQTWLSTALTNLDTCRAGFVELGVSDFVLPLMSNNVSKLISNSLAMKDDVPESQTYKGGFPSWVKAGDRRLLQSTSAAAAANLVVAQDGSGDHRTIKTAIETAAKRSGSGRYVIHVKKGVYNENIEIGKKMKNIMLVGDGLRKTIITGSRSVGGGSTTFNSATVGKITLFLFSFFISLHI